MTLMPTNGTTMPPSAVDEQVVAQEARRADGAVLDAAQRERDERDDDERVEDDRRSGSRSAGVARCMTLSASSAG